MTTYILLLALIAVITLLFIYRKTKIVKKYWRYSLILAPGIILLILKIILVVRQKPVQNQPNTLKDEITTIKDKLTEVNTVIKIEATIEKTKNDQVIKELKEVQQIKDDRERRKRFAQMLG